jgi:hypothetical protein
VIARGIPADYWFSFIHYCDVSFDRGFDPFSIYKQWFFSISPAQRRVETSFDTFLNHLEIVFGRDAPLPRATSFLRRTHLILEYDHTRPVANALMFLPTPPTQVDPQNTITVEAHFRDRRIEMDLFRGRSP